MEAALPTEGNRGNCRSCGARILWRRSRLTRRRHPIDVEPHPDGNIRVIDASWCDVLVRERRNAQGSEMAERLHLSHFATCPNAERHRVR